MKQATDQEIIEYFWPHKRGVKKRRVMLRLNSPGGLLSRYQRFASHAASACHLLLIKFFLNVGQ